MDIQTFTAHDGAKIRVVIKDGEPWFTAFDVCAALDLGNASQAVARLDDDEHTLISTEGIEGARNPNARVVSEAGLYSLILGSRKPEAKAFKRWVTHDVLPAIRKGGYYKTPEPAFPVPQTYAEALRLAADLADKVEAARPAVEFVARYVEATSAKSVSDVAKVLGKKPQEFFTYLESEGVLFKRSGSWIPYQEHIDKGRFEVKTGEKHGHAFTQAKFTPAGIAWIAGKVS